MVLAIGVVAVIGQWITDRAWRLALTFVGVPASYFIAAFVAYGLEPKQVMFPALCYMIGLIAVLSIGSVMV